MSQNLSLAAGSMFRRSIIRNYDTDSQLLTLGMCEMARVCLYETLIHLSGCMHMQCVRNTARMHQHNHYKAAHTTKGCRLAIQIEMAQVCSRK